MQLQNQSTSKQCVKGSYIVRFEVLYMGCGVLYITIKTLTDDAEETRATIIFNH